MSGHVLKLVLGHPLFGLALTIGIYLVADFSYNRFGQRAFLHPVLTSVAVIAAVVEGSGMSYQQYFSQAAPLHWGLSLFVVLLAVPLLRQMPRIRAAGVPLVLALTAGSMTAIATALAPAVQLGVSPALERVPGAEIDDCGGGGRDCRQTRRIARPDRSGGHHHRHARRSFRSRYAAHRRGSG